MSITGLIYALIYFWGLLKALSSKPIYGLYMYFFAFYAYPPARWWGETLPGLRWSFIAAIVTLISILVHSKREKLLWSEFVENKILLCFLFYIIAQSFWVISFQVHKEYIFLMFKFIMLIFIIQNSIKNDKDLIGIVLINLIGCCYYSYLGMFEHTGGRLEGLGTPGMESANQLGQHMAAILVVSAFLLFYFTRMRWFLLAIFVLILLNGVLLTQSRGVLIGLVVAGLYSMSLIPPFARRKYFTYFILALVALAVLTGPQIKNRFDEMLGNTDTQEQDASASSRFVIISAQLEMLKEAPLFGHGHRGTLLLSQIYIPKDTQTNLGNGESGRASHNFILALLVDHGIVGALLYLSVVVLCLRRVRKVFREFNEQMPKAQFLILMGLGVGLVSFMVAGLGSNNKKLEIDIWFYALIPFIAYQLKSNKVKSQKPKS